jgi:hypothetical protein
MGVAPSYLRGIEAGAILCPASSALPLANSLRWNYALVSTLLVGLAYIDVRQSNSRNVEPGGIKAKALEVIQAADGFEGFFQWVVSAIDRNGLVNDMGKSSEEIDWNNEEGFETQIANVIEMMSGAAARDTAGDSAKPSAEPRAAAAGSRKQVSSPYFQLALRQMEQSLDEIRDAVRYAAPIIPLDGFKWFHRLIRDEVTDCRAYLSSPPQPEKWQDTTLPFDFLSNGKKPSMSVRVPALVVRNESDLARIGDQIDDALKKRLPPSIRRKVFNIRATRADVKFVYNIVTQEVVLDKRQTVRNFEVQFLNAWFFEIGGVWQAFLDNYEPQADGSLFRGLALNLKVGTNLLAELKKLDAI